MEAFTVKEPPEMQYIFVTRLAVTANRLSNVYESRKQSFLAFFFVTRSVLNVINKKKRAPW